MPRGTSIYDEAYLQERLWSPTNIASLAGWWDASDTTTMTFSTGISQWNSKVGSASVSQATASFQPTYLPTSRTGAPAVNCVGQYLSYSGFPPGFVTGTSAMTLVASGTTTSSASYNAALQYGAEASGEGRQVLGNIGGSNPASAAVWGRGVASSGRNWLNTGLVTTFVVPSGTSVIYTVSASGTDVAISPAQSVSSVTAGFSIGGTPAGTYKDVGAFWHDIMFFNEALSTADVRRVEGYCAWKANTQENLTGNHPFKNRPPMIGD